MSAQARQTSGAEIADQFSRDGFLSPIDVISPAEAAEARADLEAAESELAEDREKLALLRSYPDRLLPSFDRLIRHPKLLAAVTPILGSDLMVWSAGLFIKEAHSPKIVTWHQDLTYWGLDDAEEVTAWLALSPADTASGCMRFLPGSHHQRQVPHNDSFDDNNLLSRGQEVAVEVDDAEGVNIELTPGQASLHHGHLFHASGPNTTGDRRIGAAIRYIRPSMRQTSGDKALVALVNGRDAYDHFTVAGAPHGRLAAEDFARCKADSAIKRRILYAGARTQKGQRY